jgi:outer membrane biosynthesis protein TonB
MSSIRKSSIAATAALLLFSAVHASAQEVAVEQLAEFPGGIQKFNEYVTRQVRYPKEAKKNKVKGTVFVEFFIQEDGLVDLGALRPLSREEVAQSMGPDRAAEVTLDPVLEAEAMRVIKSSPRWKPGSLRNEPTRQRWVVPVRFN